MSKNYLNIFWVYEPPYWGCHSHKALRDHFLIDSALCCYLFKDDMTEEDLVDMACYIAKYSNDKLGINHKNRVAQDVSERIKTKFEKLSSNSRISAERLHDFDSTCILQFWLRCCLSLQQQVEVSTPKLYGCILRK